MKLILVFLALAALGVAAGIAGTKLVAGGPGGAPPAPSQGVSAEAPAPEPETRPAPSVASRKPARMPASLAPGRPVSLPRSRPRTYPPAQLVAACDRAADDLRKRLDDSFEIVVSPPFVVAGNLARRDLLAYTNGTVVAPAKAMWASYFDRKPDEVITTLLLKDEKTYRHWARQLFNDRDIAFFGYYKPDKRTMVMNIRTGGGTLVHELTHALIVYDFPDVPTWFNEGLGSLHEQCNIGPARVVGLVNWRLPALQDAIRKGGLRPLGELVTKRDFRGRLRGLNYAHARYFVMYMQKQGALEKFYRHFRAHHTGADADVKAIEHVFGKSIDKVDKEFVAWVRTLRLR